MTKKIEQETDGEAVAYSNFRVSKSDYYLIKMEALRQQKTVQEFLNVAVAEYCARHGVILSGKNPTKTQPKK